LSGADGNTAVLYEYSVYGQVAASDPNHPNRFMFTGREFDADTGLYYYRARYYHPEIGRFLQTDPIGYGDGMNAYRYVGNGPGRWSDPFGLARKSWEELPRNNGDPIQISIAFYNGSAPGFYTDKNGKLHANASGAQFQEAADDFVVDVGGDTYELYFDMGDIADLDSLTEFISARLAGLEFYGYDVTDVYFFDHSVVASDTDATIIGLQFGENVYITAAEIAAHGKDYAWDRILPENATVHFRHCYVGNEKNRGLLKNLAVWTNRSATGGTGATNPSYPHDDGDVTKPTPYDPTWEDGYAPDLDPTDRIPDYTYGSLWGASPTKAPGEIWAQYRPVTLLEYITKGWEGTVLNENQPY
jgi:RHS repeat-associated protein